MTNNPQAFHYGSPEPTARLTGHDEKPQQPPATGDAPPTEDRGGGPLTTRLVLMALTIILLGTAAGLAGALVLPRATRRARRSSTP